MMLFAQVITTILLLLFLAYMGHALSSVKSKATRYALSALFTLGVVALMIGVWQ